MPASAPAGTGPAVGRQSHIAAPAARSQRDDRRRLRRARSRRQRRLAVRRRRPGDGVMQVICADERVALRRAHRGQSRRRARPRSAQPAARNSSGSIADAYDSLVPPPSCRRAEGCPDPARWSVDREEVAVAGRAGVDGGIVDGQVARRSWRRRERVVRPEGDQRRETRRDRRADVAAALSGPADRASSRTTSRRPPPDEPAAEVDVARRPARQLDAAVLGRRGRCTSRVPSEAKERDQSRRPSACMSVTTTQCTPRARPVVDDEHGSGRRSDDE